MTSVMLDSTITLLKDVQNVVVPVKTKYVMQSQDSVCVLPISLVAHATSAITPSGHGMKLLGARIATAAPLDPKIYNATSLQEFAAVNPVFREISAVNAWMVTRISPVRAVHHVPVIAVEV